MSDLIRKRDIDYISAPIAPVLKGENVHYEYVAFRKQIEDISPVPAISISDIEGIKAEIEKRQELNTTAFKCDYNEMFDSGRLLENRKILEIIDRHIKEYTE